MSNPAPEPAPTPDPAPAPAPDPAPDPAPQPERPDVQGFMPITTQAEFDRIVGRVRRTERERFNDYDDLKKKADEFDKLQEANASELEKAQKRAEEAERKAAEIEQSARTTNLRAAILAEAAKSDHKIVDASAVVAFLTGEDADFLEVDEQGAPKNLSGAVKALLERRPYLVDANGGKARRNAADQGAQGEPGEGQITREALKDMSPEQIRDALREGKLTETLKGGAS